MSHGDTPMCQNMVSQCQTIKKLWAGHESVQTDRQTDGLTDGQTEWFLYIFLNFVPRGIINGQTLPLWLIICVDLQSVNYGTYIQFKSMVLSIRGNLPYIQFQSMVLSITSNSQTLHFIKYAKGTVIVFYQWYICLVSLCNGQSSSLSRSSPGLLRLAHQS